MSFRHIGVVGAILGDVKTEEKPPTSHYHSLGVVVAWVESL